jgi:hypothetical protein
MKLKIPAAILALLTASATFHSFFGVGYFIPSEARAQGKVPAVTCHLGHGKRPVFNHLGEVTSTFDGDSPTFGLMIKAKNDSRNTSRLVAIVYRIKVKGGWYDVYKLTQNPDQYVDVSDCETPFAPKQYPIRDPM